MSYEDLFWGVDHDPDSKEPVNFLETRFFDLSPFSPHQIEIWGETFPTVEHAYQAARIKPGKEREIIKNAKSPLDAWRAGQKYKADKNLLKPDFDKDAIMEELFRAKIDQHPDIGHILKETRNRELLKIYPKDLYWGTNSSKEGKNKMGKLWMKLRDELKSIN